MVRTAVVLLWLLGTVFGQSLRWAYRYNGSANSTDRARSVLVGRDGNVYAAGFSWGSASGSDFTVISLKPDSTERWVRRYVGPTDYVDRAEALVWGNDGNLYVAGQASWTYAPDSVSNDFAVIKWDTAGNQRGLYVYPSRDFDDDACAIAYGNNDNIYAAGYVVLGEWPDIHSDLAVVRLDTLCQRLSAYTYDGPAVFGDDAAQSMTLGPRGCVYAAGHSEAASGNLDLFVAGLSDTCGERWTYTFGSGNLRYNPVSVVCGGDSCIYAAGRREDDGSTVIKLDTARRECWVSELPFFHVTSMAWGPGGNLYLVGDSAGLAGDFFCVVSLDTAGRERWTRTYGKGYARAITSDAGGSIYVAGEIGETFTDVAVLRLDAGGTQRWFFTWDGGLGLSDQAVSVACGPGGRVYVAGHSGGGRTQFDDDFLVISLDTLLVAVGEGRSGRTSPAVGLAIGTLQDRVLDYSLSLDQPGRVLLSLYDLSGRRISSWQTSATSGVTRQVRSLPNCPAGAYFLTAAVADAGRSETRRLVLLK